MASNKQKRAESTEGLGGAGVLIVSTFLPNVIPDGAKWALAAVGALVALWGFRYRLGWRDQDERPYPAKPALSDPVPATPAAEEQLTLRQLFMEDFNQFASLGHDIPYDTPTGIETVRMELGLDPTNNVKVPRFYIPYSGDLLRMLRSIANDYDWLMQEPFKNLDLHMGYAGDREMVKKDDLRFPGRVFVYHENTLSIQQAAEADRAFTEKGAKVQLRGPEYLTMKMLSGRVAAASRPAAASPHP